MDITLAHIYNHNGSGGGCIQAQNLLNEWGEHGIDAWGVHANNLGSPESFVTVEPGYPLMYPTNISDGLREIDPDVVFVHGYSVGVNSQLRQLSDSDDFDATFILRKGMNLLESWFTSPGQGSSNYLAQVSRLEWYDGIICPTMAVRDRLSVVYDDNCPKLGYVRNGIPRDEYVPSSYMSDGYLRVVTVSRVAANNYIPGPELAVGSILDAEDFPIKMDIFGAGNDAMDDIVRSIAADYDDITVHGKVDHDAIREHLEQADVVCVPSFSHQAVPLAAVEGMAAGNVILGSFPEAQEEPAIIHVPATHPPAWRQALTDAHDDPDDARDYVTDGIESAADYDISTVVEDGYLPIFEEWADV